MPVAPEDVTSAVPTSGGGEGGNPDRAAHSNRTAGDYAADDGKRRHIGVSRRRPADAAAVERPAGTAQEGGSYRQTTRAPEAGQQLTAADVVRGPDDRMGVVSTLPWTKSTDGGKSCAACGRVTSIAEHIMIGGGLSTGVDQEEHDDDVTPSQSADMSSHMPTWLHYLRLGARSAWRDLLASDELGACLAIGTAAHPDLSRGRRMAARSDLNGGQQTSPQLSISRRWWYGGEREKEPATTIRLSARSEHRGAGDYRDRDELTGNADRWPLFAEC